MANNKWNSSLYNTKGSFVTNYGESLIDFLAPKVNETILDLGCGTGKLTSEISKLANKVYGIDLSKDMINDAKKVYPEIDFLVKDAQKQLDFENNFFDAVFSNAALHWMLDSKSVINNVYETLKSGGRFVFEMGGKGNIKQVLNALDKQAKKLNLKNFRIQNFYPSISEYTQILEEVGFTVKFAELYDRPTLLQGENGLRNWTEIFRTNLLEQIDNKESFFQEVEKSAKPYLYKNGKWYADYVRLRIIAYKD